MMTATRTWSILWGTALIALLMGVAVAGSPAHYEALPLTSPILIVSPLRDAGGLTERGRDGQPLNVRLTQALQKHLSDMAAGRFVVVSKSDKTTRAGIALTLEGDLSHVESDDPSGGAYLCVLRLFREGKPRQLICQWAGVADSLRWLTGNLPGNPRIDKEGLIGELGKRIVPVVVSIVSGGEQQKAFADLVASASKLKRVDIIVMPEAPKGDPRAVMGEVVSGGKYRLKVSSQDAGSVFIVGVGAGGRPQALFVPEPEREIEVAPGRSVMLPPQDPLSAGAVTVTTEREVVVLVRRKVRDAGSTPRGAARIIQVVPKDSDTSPKTTDTSAKTDKKDDGGANDAPSPVRILHGGGSHPLPPPDDPAVTRLLKIAASDPPGTWVAQRVKVRVIPRTDTR